MLSDDPLWYKDAIIYQTHVKSFFDSTGDGMGDFIFDCINAAIVAHS